MEPFFLDQPKNQQGSDVAQLVECRTSTPLTQVQFPRVARDFSPSQQRFSYMRPYTPMCRHALTSVHMLNLKILWSMSEFGGFWKH